jgi:hypothetical protein
MTLAWAAAAAAIVFAVGVVWLFASKPRPLTFRQLTQTRLRELLAILYYRGFEGAALHVGMRRSTILVTVTKDIVADNDVHLRMELPLGDLWKPHESAIREVVEAVKIGHEWLGPSADTPGQLRIDFARDLDSAESVVRAVLERVSGRDLAAHGHARLYDVAEGRYKIGWTYPHAP